MSLQGSLYVGVSALQTAQNSLNVTAHNLSNLDTTGFVRQQVLFGTREYNTVSGTAAVSKQQVGLGVNFSRVRQVRDLFLDKTYREESGRLAFYEVSYNAITEIETVLGEMDGAAFNESLRDMWTAVQEAAKDPSNSVVQGLLVQRAAEFVENASAVYQSLNDYQDNLNMQISDQVGKINSMAEQIHTLNLQITSVEVGGVERANDLRDARNQLIDELSALGNISYTEDTEGAIIVQLEGVPLVMKDKANSIGLYTDPTTGFYTPYWEQNAVYSVNAAGEEVVDIDGAIVFDLSRPISSALDTDIGSVKALLHARGDHRANYTDLLDEEYYEANVAPSVIMNVQAEFDQLVHAVVTSVNQILADSSDPSSGYLCNEDGSPIQLFQKQTTDGYEEATDAFGNILYDVDGNIIWNYVQEQTGAGGTAYDSTTLYTISNLKINQELLQVPTLLGFVKEDGSIDYDTLNKMKDAFDEAAYSLNPSVVKYSNFVDYYSDLVSQVANSGSVYKSIYSNQEVTVNTTENSRQQVIGVSSDEELSNMIRFQNAYNAASRYINVVDELLEHLVTAM